MKMILRGMKERRTRAEETLEEAQHRGVEGARAALPTPARDEGAGRGRAQRGILGHGSGSGVRGLCESLRDRRGDTRGQDKNS